MDAVSAKKPSLGNLSSLYIRELIQERNPMDVTNVENSFLRNQSLVHTENTHRRETL